MNLPGERADLVEKPAVVSYDEQAALVCRPALLQVLGKPGAADVKLAEVEAIADSTIEQLTPG